MLRKRRCFGLLGQRNSGYVITEDQGSGLLFLTRMMELVDPSICVCTCKGNLASKRFVELYMTGDQDRIALSRLLNGELVELPYAVEATDKCYMVIDSLANGIYTSIKDSIEDNVTVCGALRLSPEWYTSFEAILLQFSKLEVWLPSISQSPGIDYLQDVRSRIRGGDWEFLRDTFGAPQDTVEKVCAKCLDRVLKLHRKRRLGKGLSIGQCWLSDCCPDEHSETFERLGLHSRFCSASDTYFKRGIKSTWKLEQYIKYSAFGVLLKDIAEFFDIPWELGDIEYVIPVNQATVPEGVQCVPAENEGIADSPKNLEEVNPFELDAECSAAQHLDWDESDLVEA